MAQGDVDRVMRLIDEVGGMADQAEMARDTIADKASPAAKALRDLRHRLQRMAQDLGSTLD